jgi:SAM-dependent methyltransferase
MTRANDPTAMAQLYADFNADFVRWTPSARFQAAFNAAVLSPFRSVQRRSLQVVELGCGHGTWLERLLEVAAVENRSLTALGVDITPERIAQARRNLASHSGVELVCADILQYQATGPFDMVYCVEVWQHLSQSDQARLIEAWIERIRPGGVFVILDKDRGSFHSRMLELQKRLGSFDFLMGRLRRFPARFRPLFETIRYPDFQWLRSRVEKHPEFQVQLVRSREFTGLVARREVAG